MISIARHRFSLALGNIVGSAISNILGAYSLGLIFRKNEAQIASDRSSKIYTLLLLLLTILIAGLSKFGRHDMWTTAGAITISLFAVYVVSIAWLITKGAMTAPEVSDSDDDSDNDSHSAVNEDRISHDEGDIIERAESTHVPETTNLSSSDALVPITRAPTQASGPAVDIAQSDSTPTLAPEPERLQRDNHKHSITYHSGILVLGFLAILLSSYVLSNAATNLIDEVGISDVLFGVVILSVATTLPEKFIAVTSGYRGHNGILVANTVGSNIFLLSLCMGILWVSSAGAFDQGSMNALELGVLLGSTVAMTLVVWFGQRWSRWLGVLMLLAYIAFLVLEFTVIRKV